MQIWLVCFGQPACCDRLLSHMMKRNKSQINCSLQRVTVTLNEDENNETVIDTLPASIRLTSRSKHCTPTRKGTQQQLGMPLHKFAMENWRKWTSPRPRPPRAECISIKYATNIKRRVYHVNLVVFTSKLELFVCKNKLELTSRKRHDRKALNANDITYRRISCL